MSQNKSLKPQKSRQADPRIERTRAGLRSALLALLDVRPFEAIPVRDICEAGGAGYATFFRHYRDKNALLDDVIQNYLDMAREAVVPLFDVASGMAGALAICRFVEAHRLASRILLTGGASQAVRQEFVDQVIRWARVLHEASAGGVPASGLPGRLAIVYPTAGILEVLCWWLGEGDGHPAEDVAALIDRLVLTPVRQFSMPFAG